MSSREPQKVILWPWSIRHTYEELYSRLTGCGNDGGSMWTRVEGRISERCPLPNTCTVEDPQERGSMAGLHTRTGGRPCADSAPRGGPRLARGSYPPPLHRLPRPPYCELSGVHLPGHAYTVSFSQEEEVTPRDPQPLFISLLPLTVVLTGCRWWTLVSHPTVMAVWAAVTRRTWPVQVALVGVVCGGTAWEVCCSHGVSVTRGGRDPDAPRPPCPPAWGQPLI